MAAVNRYRFTEKIVEQAKAWLRTKKGTKPSFLERFDGEVKKGNLYLGKI